MKREPKLRFPEFSGEWEEKRIKDILKIRHGKDQKKIECLDGAYPILGTGGALGRTNSFLYNKESVLIGRKGTIDKPMYISTPFWTVDTLFYSEINEQYSVKFIYYMFNTITWKKYSEASGVPSLSASTIESINVNLSSLPEQQKIADCLTAMDESIESQQQKVEQLKAYKKGLLQQIFSQSLRFPGFEGEWKEKKLGEVGDIKKGEQLNKNLLKPNGKYYALNGGVEPSGYTDKYNSLANTISISEGGNSCGYVNFNKENFWSGGHCYTLENLTNSVSVTFLFQSLKHNQEKIMNLRVGTGLPNIQKTALSKFQIQIPHCAEQKKIADCLSTLDEVIELESQKFEQLRQYKKGLLQQLFV